ncbi:sugar transporter SWEET1 [Toxorhynchites rutilus septentrionalis]|uniref:sugar transporter SWEET1 n=1 Tax=Toxorhynchites rutilus septentrionalis TaxID=329112 RepID=UPI00247870F0|nr:sugar transporter SWEET1 [Toxorhynchites rutilus septentrionalis]
MALMENLSFKDFLASSATVSTVFQFLTGSLICYKYIRKKSTGETSGLPFVAGFLSCFLWFKYGILTEEHTVIFVNIIGSALFFAYVLIYFTFSVNKRVIIRQFLGVCVFILVCTVYTTYELNPAKAIEVIGLVCCCVGVLFFASPLTKLAHVMRTKNAESLPFPIIIASFFVSLQWFIYGLLIDDKFIQVPNLLGCILSSIQLFLYVIYPSQNLTSIAEGASYQLLRSQDNIL